MELDNIKELNKLENQIKETQKLLKNNSNDITKIKTLKEQKTIFGLLALLFLLTSISFLFFNHEILTLFNPNAKTKSTEVVIDTIIQKNNKQDKKLLNDNSTNTNNLTNNFNKSLNFENEEVIFNLQLAAFKNEEIISSNLILSKELSEDEYQRFIVGNFTKYEEVLFFKDKLKKRGFKDSFVIAKTYGEKITIKEALILSNEPEFIKK